MRLRLVSIGLTLLLLGFALLVAFRLIGSTIDENGFLREPFGLLPIGWLLVVFGATCTVIAAIRSRSR
jgi:Protein of unknown function (DUF3955)